MEILDPMHSDFQPQVSQTQVYYVSSNQTKSSPKAKWTSYYQIKSTISLPAAPLMPVMTADDNIVIRGLLSKVGKAVAVVCAQRWQSTTDTKTRHVVRHGKRARLIRVFTE